MSTANALACPACGQRCLSAWDKLWLGPARSVRCGSCSCRVSVPWLPTLAFLLVGNVAPFILLALVWQPLLRRFGSVSFAVFAMGSSVLLFVFAALSLWAYVRWIPLLVLQR